MEYLEALLAGFAVLLAFAGIYLVNAIVMSRLTTWARLMKAYPDQPDEPSLLRLRSQDGKIGNIRAFGTLNLSICSAGLRVGVMRLFAPFGRDFFVPWNEITVVRKSTPFGSVAHLQFGNPVIGTLQLPDYVADRLALGATERWPEQGPIGVETRRAIATTLLQDWAIIASLTALFLMLVVHAAGGGGLQFLLAILFPVIGFGILFIVRYFTETRRLDRENHLP